MRKILIITISFFNINQLTWATPKCVIIIRHGEKTGNKNDENLDQKGKERSYALIPYFLGRDEFKDIKIDAIFAKGLSKDSKSHRTKETIQPLAKKLKLEINSQFTYETINKLAQFIKEDKSLDNKNVLICWDHKEIIDLIKLLGATPDMHKWHGKIYDLTIMLKFKNTGEISYKKLYQELMFGDSKNKQRNEK